MDMDIGMSGEVSGSLGLTTSPEKYT